MQDSSSAAATTDDATLASDMVGIQRTLSLYCRLADTARWRELAELYQHDATHLSDTDPYVGRDEIFAFFASKNRGPGETMHLTSVPVVDVDGDSAVAESDYVAFLVTAAGPESLGLGQFHDRLVRSETGDWRFAFRHKDPLWTKGAS